MIDIKEIDKKIKSFDKTNVNVINSLIKEYQTRKEYVSYDESLLKNNVLLQKCFFHINLKLIKNHDERLDYIDKYNHLFYDWYCTDLLIGLVKKASVNKMINYTKKYRHAKDEYIVRWGYVMYISNINKKDKSLLNKLLPLLIDDERYMVMMGEAWLLCELAVYHPNEIYEYIKSSKLNYKTLSKAISKIYDSFRISDEYKSKFLLLREEIKTN
ncbi:MAG: DNA alkylation repair protein [Bacilli bacterium]